MNESGSHQVISVKLRRKQRVRRVIDLLVSSCDVVSSALHLSISDPACAGDEKEDLKSVCIYDTCRVLGLTDNSILWVDVRLDSEAAMREMAEAEAKKRRKEEATSRKEKRAEKLQVLTRQSGQSTHSLLEAVIGALESVSQDEASLLVLVKLIRDITAPYENCSVSPLSSCAATGASIDGPIEAKVDGLKNESETPLGTVAAETVDLTVHSKKSAKKEEKGATKAGHRLLNVPPAVLARESLYALCDVLRSDGCSKDVFNCIEVTIARLAKINGNQNILTSLLVGVVADMADVAASKLKEFSVSLREVEDAAAPALSSREARADDTVGEASNATVAKPSKLTASQLPMMMSSSRHHERLYRSLLTLQAISRKLIKTSLILLKTIL